MLQIKLVDLSHYETDRILAVASGMLGVQRGIVQWLNILGLRKVIFIIATKEIIYFSLCVLMHYIAANFDIQRDVYSWLLKLKVVHLWCMFPFEVLFTHAL